MGPLSGRLVVRRSEDGRFGGRHDGLIGPGRELGGCARELGWGSVRGLRLVAVEAELCNLRQGKNLWAVFV